MVASSKVDAIIVGAGHNGLVTAGYLAKAGLNVSVLERRHIVGGTCTTEEIAPGFRISRTSYVAGMLLLEVVRDFPRLAQSGAWVSFKSCLEHQTSPPSS